MRYFKCDALKPEDREIIFSAVALTEEEKKSNRQGIFLNSLGTLLFSVTFIVLFVGCCFLIAQIPIVQNPFLFILVIIGMILLGFCALIVAIIVGTLVSSPLYKTAQRKLVVHKRIYFDKALIFLREHYGFAEPCLVTKCYDSSDKNFRKRDVCIFLADDELRITADLKNGFSHREKDLGCYAFKTDEFCLAHIQGEKFLITELKYGDTVFLMGRRAKGFIEKNFISNE